MLYHAYDFQYKASRPIYHVASLGQQLLEHPLNPFSYTPMAKPTAAVLESISRTLHCYDKQGFDCESVEIDGKQVLVEENVLVDTPFCQLRRFSKPLANLQQPKLLLMAPLSGHHATLLKGTVQSLLVKHDVYITDWKDARDIPVSEGHFGMDDYVTTVLDFMKKIGPNTHILAVCQPSVQALQVAALLADTDLAPPSVTIMAGPIDTRINPTSVDRFADKYSLEQFRQRVICPVPYGYAGEGRKVYPGFLQLVSFMSMNMGAHIRRTIGFIDDIAHGKDDQANDYREFYDEYLAVMDMPAEFYLECVDKVFKNHELARGVLTYKGQPIDLSVIKQSALFTIEGEKDDITGAGQTEAAHGLCSSLPAKMRKHYVQQGAGHYGVFNGFRFRNGILPKVEAFIAKHDAA